MIQYKKDAFGRRVSKNGTTFVYDSSDRLISQSDGLQFFYDTTGVAGFIYNGAKYLYRKDAQGNIVALINTTGAKVVDYYYDAWGNCTYQTVISTFDAVAEANPFRYRGYYYDKETGFYYLKSRYYDPTICRFVSIDDLEFVDPEKINGLNLYAYCGNNPVMNIDPNGNAWWDILIAAVVTVVCTVTAVATGNPAAIGASISGGLSLVTQLVETGDVNTEKFLLDTAVGAVTGAVAGSSIGRAGATIISAGLGAASELGSQLIENKTLDKVNWNEVGTSAVINGGLGFFAGEGINNPKFLEDEGIFMLSRIVKDPMLKSVQNKALLKAFVYSSMPAAVDFFESICGLF